MVVPSAPFALRIPAMLTAPCESQTTEAFRQSRLVRTTVVLAPMVMLVKLQTLLAHLFGNVLGSSVTVPEAVRLSAPSAPVEPLVNCACRIAGTAASAR